MRDIKKAANNNDLYNKFKANYPRNHSWTRLHRESFTKNGMLSVRFLGPFAPTRKLRIVILRKAFAVTQMGLKNVQSNE